MVECVTNEKNINLSFSKEYVSPEELSEFVEKIKTREILSKSTLREKDALELSDELKSSWWEENKEKFLSKFQK
ncbi:MAG: hypothetical protein ACLFOC_09260 [Campylobacterales bacterium]